MQAFVAQRALPKLACIAISLYGEQIEDWCYWNDALVGQDNVRQDSHEIESRYLAGSGVHVISAFTSAW